MATLVVFASLGLARFGYTTVLPAMQQGLHFDNTRAGALASANLAGYLLMAVLSGALASRFGPRIVIALGLTVTGAGSGASNVPAMALLAAWFTAQRRGLASGIGVAGSSLALMVLGPAVPRVLAAAGEGGWRLCWYAFGAAALAVAVAGGACTARQPCGSSAWSTWRSASPTSST